MMSKTIPVLLAIGLISGPVLAASEEPTVIACMFEKQPPMIMIIRGGMGASDNTLQVGQTPPVQLDMGSSMMIATFRAKEYSFSLREPASVTISGAGSKFQTFNGECISTLQPPASQ